MNPYVDITANKHGGNKQSQDANIKLAPYKLGWQERILGFISIRDKQGLATSRRHAADHFGKEAGQISGRFTELRVAGKIEETLVTEDGFMLYRLPGSKNVPVVRRRLLVVGEGLCADAVFEKTTRGWQIARINPKLRAIIGDTPIDKIGEVLKARGLTYSWV